MCAPLSYTHTCALSSTHPSTTHAHAHTHVPSVSSRAIPPCVPLSRLRMCCGCGLCIARCLWWLQWRCGVHRSLRLRVHRLGICGVLQHAAGYSCTHYKPHPSAPSQLKCPTSPLDAHPCDTHTCTSCSLITSLLRALSLYHFPSLPPSIPPSLRDSRNARW